MRLAELAVAVFVMGLTACQSMPEDSAEPGELAAQITAANAELTARFNAGDMAGVAELYDDDAMLVGPSGRRVSGREAIDAYWERFADGVDWRLEVLEVEGGGDVAVQRGRSHITWRPELEREVSTVEFVLIWRRSPDGDWRALVDVYWP